MLTANFRAAQDAATRTWLENRARRRREAEWVDADELEQLVTISPYEIELGEEYGYTEGWRFGAAISGGIGSPWVQGHVWPKEGLRAICTLQGDKAPPAYRDVETLGGAAVLRAHDDCPVRLCCCGLYIEQYLEDLLEPMRPGSLYTVGKRMGIPGLAAQPPMRSYWGMNRPPDVVYQAQGWGLRAHAVDPPTSIRKQYMRVRPGGRAYLHRSRPQHAEILGEKYGLEVIVGETLGWDWLDEIAGAEIAIPAPSGGDSARPG